MLENTPTQSTMTELLGQPLFAVWQELCSAIDEKYDMERLWNTGGKNWVYEYKYRRGGKTLCSLYAKKNSLLSDFLYEAIYIPDGTAAPPKSVITCPELQVYIADFGNSKHDKALIVEVDGNIVGAIWARIMNDYGHIDENTPSLAMSVLKAYRGMGIGTLLLTQMLLAEKAAGYAKISLSVQKDNYAVKLYRKAGFTTVKETTEEYIMVADLNSICKMEEENGF